MGRDPVAQTHPMGTPVFTPHSMPIIFAWKYVYTMVAGVPDGTLSVPLSTMH